ncbi:MAG: spore germination protein [Mollicutes bacterium]|nr:spore germination protein [Mollicutes bacterium]
MNNKQNFQSLDEILGLNITFDIVKRTITNHNNLVFTFYYDSFLSNSLTISRLITSFIKLKDKIDENNIKDVITNNLIAENLKFTSNLTDASQAVFNGDLVLTCDITPLIFIAETKQYPSRSISEPDGEKVVRGSRDGFTENFATNIGLIRRRIKTGKLGMKVYELGTVSKTKVALVYLKDVIKPNILRTIMEKLNNIKVKELTMSDKALEELLVNHRYSPYPLVKYTERPDTLAIHLYQGMFGLIVDTSPSAILGPVSIFDHLQHAEEFRQTVVAGSYLRLIRIIGIVIAFFSIPLWYALTDYNLPNILKPFIPSSHNHNILFLQLITVLIGIELIRMASIHTPSALSTSMGLVSGLIIGDVAIKVGLFTEQIVILAAISAIGSYITPSYELSLANKMANIFLLLSVYFFKMPGFICGTILLIIYLACLKSFKRPYLYPLIPLNIKDLFKQLFRVPYKHKEKTKH